MTISNQTRDRVKGVFEPIALALGRLGLSPDALTLIGFGIAILAAVAAATQNWLVAGLLVVFGGVFDLFDGALARATGKASPLGAFMDSVFDRWGEGIIYVGIAWGCINGGFGLGAVLAAAALASAFMVSYTRAKSEGLGFTEGTGMAAVGLAPREVRIVILTVGLIVVAFLGEVSGSPDCETAVFTCFGSDATPGANALAFTLGLIIVLATITVIQRIVHVLRQPNPEEHP